MNYHQLVYDRRESRPAEIELLSADGRLVIGAAFWAGVTLPGYALRYTYCVHLGRLYNQERDGVVTDTGLYVLDADHLVPLAEWYAAHRRKPDQPSSQTLARARSRRRGQANPT